MLLEGANLQLLEVLPLLLDLLLPPPPLLLLLKLSGQLHVRVQASCSDSGSRKMLRTGS